VSVQLPSGHYRVSTLAAGRYLAENTVSLDSDRSVRLAFRQRASFRIIARDESGQPVPAFEVVHVAGNIQLPMALVHAAFLPGTSYPGRDGVADVTIPEGYDGAEVQAADRTFVVRASGMSLKTVVVSIADQASPDIAVSMRAGTVVVGSAPERSRDARWELRLRRDASGASWDAGRGPLADAVRPEPDGSFRLNGYGPGTYELYAVTPASSVFMGEVVSTAPGEVRAVLTAALGSVVVVCETTDARPATLPRLHRWVPAAGWGSTGWLDPAALVGAWDGSAVRFGDLRSGEYELVGPDGYASGGRFMVGAGEQVERRWNPRPTRVVRLSVSFPTRPPHARLVVGAIPIRKEPVGLAAVVWSAIGADGTATLTALEGVRVQVVVGATGIGDDTTGPGTGVDPVFMKYMHSIATLDGATLHVPELCRLRVEGDGVQGGLVELFRTDADPLRTRWTARLGKQRAYLPAGRYRIVVTEVGGRVDAAGQLRKAEAEVELAAGRDEVVTVGFVD